ncbi:FMN-binding negative transcriptional regulator, partial [Marivivens sp.]|uniref:FMN-binding negative transcriptional regulator n=1 Tax=Marivivens sp. TaxID=1978374 RepID=UPI0025C154B0
MHPNPIYRQTPPDQAIEFARDRAFGTLTVNGDEGPLASHVPFLLSEDGKIADIHLVRSNPIVRAISEPQKCLLAVNGADGRSQGLLAQHQRDGPAGRRGRRVHPPHDQRAGPAAARANPPDAAG